MNTQKTYTNTQMLYRCLMALRLEVDGSIVDHIKLTADALVGELQEKDKEIERLKGLIETILESNK